MVININKFKTIPIEKVVNIPENDGFYRLYKNRYWAVDANDNLLFYESTYSPQCNLRKSIIEERIIEPTNPSVKVVFLEKVLIPININDYI
jgi:hypothetical protein